MLMRKVDYICKCCLGISFSLITLYLVYICLYGDYIAEALMARALPLSISLIAISILFFSIVYKSKD